MKKQIIFWLSLLAIAIGLYALGTNRSEAAVVISDYNDQHPRTAFQIHCEGDQLQATADECGAKINELCPTGGEMVTRGSSGPKGGPFWIKLVVACNPDPTKTRL